MRVSDRADAESQRQLWGNRQEDIATQAELERARDPLVREGVDKLDKIDHQEETSTNHPADKTP